MKTRVAAIFAVLCFQPAIAEEVAFKMAINDDIKVAVCGSIMADTPISATIDLKLIKNSAGKAYYDCDVHFSRAPSMRELKALQLEILPEDYLSDPLGMGTVYSERAWKDLKGDVWDVNLIRMTATIQTSYGPDEPVLYSITSGSGYADRREIRTDSNGRLVLRWLGLQENSLIRAIPTKDYTGHTQGTTKPVWKRWRFAPSSNGKEGAVTPLNESN